MTVPTASEPHLVAEIVRAQPAAGMPAWWDALSRNAGNASVFLSTAWMQTWLEIYGADFELFWVCWREAGNVVGGCLLASRTTWSWLLPSRSLFLNASGETLRRSPMAEYNDILCRPGYEDRIALAAAHALRDRTWSRLHLSGYRDDAVMARIAGALPIVGVEDNPRNAYFADLAAVGERSFETALAGKVGSHIRRNRRLYEKEYGPFQVLRAETRSDADRYFDELAALHNKRWRARGQGGSFSSEAVVRFHRQVIGRLWNGGMVDLLCVRSNDRVAGYLYNFISQNKVYVFQTGFAYEDGSKLSPGLLTHLLAIEYYRQRGLDEYDLLAGDALYKRSLARGTRGLRWTVVYRDRFWPRLLLWAKRLKARLSRPTMVPEDEPD